MVPSFLSLVEEMQRRPAGGSADTAMLMTGGAALLMSSAAMLHAPPALVTAAGAVGMLICVHHFAGVFLEPVVSAPLLPSKSGVPSDDASQRPHETGSKLLLGYCTDSGEPLSLTASEAVRHLFVQGGTGTGKSVFGYSLAHQQVLQGGGMLWIDAKIDPDNLQAIWASAMSAGRCNDVLVINPGEPSSSVTYNPILFGDPDEVASRILALVPTSEHASPGADHYRQEALQGLTTVVGALQRAGLAYDMLDLSVLLMSPRALEDLHQRLLTSPACRDTPQARALSLLLDKFQDLNRANNRVEININRLKETFGGISGRMAVFGAGNFGKVMNTYTPQIELFEAIRNNKIIYLALPTMGKCEAALNFAKLLLGDLRTAISWLQQLPEHDRPDPPFLCLLDEMGSYATPALARPIEQARSARIVLCNMVQSLANLEAVSKEFRQIILGNSWTKVYFKVGEQDSALAASENIGKEIQVMRSLSDSSTVSSSTSFLRATPDSTNARGASVTQSEREVEGYRVHPDSLKHLGLGEAVVTVGSEQVFNVRVSMPKVLEDAIAKCGPPTIRCQDLHPARAIGGTRRHQPYVAGANYGVESDRFLREAGGDPTPRSDRGGRSNRNGRDSQGSRDGRHDSDGQDTRTDRPQDLFRAHAASAAQARKRPQAKY